jgi:hypothetical protein
VDEENGLGAHASERTGGATVTARQDDESARRTMKTAGPAL